MGWRVSASPQTHKAPFVVSPRRHNRRIHQRPILLNTQINQALPARRGRRQYQRVKQQSRVGHGEGNGGGEVVELEFALGDEAVDGEDEDCGSGREMVSEDSLLRSLRSARGYPRKIEIKAEQLPTINIWWLLDILYPLNSFSCEVDVNPSKKR